MESEQKNTSKYLVGGLAATGLIFIGLGWGAWSYAQKYDGVIAPNVFIGSLDIGRKTPEQAREILQKRTDELLTHGIDVRLNGETKNLPLSTLIGSDLIEYVNFDLDETLKTSEAARHDDNPVVNTNKILYALIRPFYTGMRFSIQTPKLNQSLHALKLHQSNN